MNVEANGYTIEVTNKELWELAITLKQALIYQLKNHWVNHQSVWRQQNSSKLTLLYEMFNALGRLDLYEVIFKDADTIFAEFNEPFPST